MFFWRGGLTFRCFFFFGVGVREVEIPAEGWEPGDLLVVRCKAPTPSVSFSFLCLMCSFVFFLVSFPVFCVSFRVGGP